MPIAIVLNDWAARELGARPGDRIDARLLPLGRRRPALTTQTADVHVAARRADSPAWPPIAASRRSIPASPSGEPGRLGSAVPDRSVAGPSAGRALLGRLSDDAEGVHRLRARPRAVAIALRRADVDCASPSRRRADAAQLVDGVCARAARDASRRVAMGVTLIAGARARARRHRPARPTSASTSPTSASSSSSRRCCWRCCSSSSASSSGCARSASCAPPASRWRPSGGCSSAEAVVLAVVGGAARRGRRGRSTRRLIVYGLRHLVGRRGRHDAARAARLAARRWRSARCRRRGRGGDLRRACRCAPSGGCRRGRCCSAQSLDELAAPTPSARGAARAAGADLRGRRRSRCWRSGSSAAPRRPARSSAPARRCSSACCCALGRWLRARDARPITGRGTWAVVAPRLPQRVVPPGAQRAVGGAHRVGDLHHRLGRRVPPRRRRAHAAIRSRAPAATCCWRSPSCRSCRIPNDRGRPRRAAHPGAGAGARPLHALPRCVRARMRAA